MANTNMSNVGAVWERSTEAVRVSLGNGVKLTFGLSGGMLTGLTEATADRLPLISPGNSRLPIVETRDGWSVTAFRFKNITAHGAGVVLESEVLGIKPGIGRKIDVFEVPFVTTPRRIPAVLGTFRWVLTPQNETLGHPAVRRDAYAGFSYTYEFELTHPFHWILDAGTWEVSGDPEGVILLSQHMAPVGGPMEQRISRSGPCYTSGETFVKGSSNNADVIPDIPTDPAMGYIIPIQAQMRGAGGAIVDVQYKDDGVLLCYYEKADYFRTLVEWRSDDPGIGHLDHHFFPLTNSHVTPAKTILAARVPGLTRADAINRWTDAWEHVAGLWRRQVGVRREDPVVGFGLDCCGGIGTHYGSGPADLFERWEARFSSLHDQGIEYLFVGGIGNHRGAEAPFSANMCQPYDYSVTERYGGPGRFKLFCQRAHDKGLKIGLWFGAHISDHAPILKKHPEWTINYDCGTPWDGGYRTIRSCSFRRGFSEWLLAQFRELKTLGLDLLFLDSYHNLGAMPIDYGDPTLSPQIQDLWALQADCDRMGLPILIESVGPIGVTSCGLWPAHLKSLEMNYWANYRTDLSELQNGKVTPATYFRMLANKAPIGCGVLEQSNEPYAGTLEYPKEMQDMNRLYRQIRQTMQIRTLHSDGSIEWCDAAAQKRILFAMGEGSVTVREGFAAEPLYGATRRLAPGRHVVDRPVVFQLVPQ